MSKDPAVDLAALKAELLVEVRKDFDAKLAESNKKQEAELAKAYVEIAGLKENRKKDLIDAAAKDGRIVPASRAAVEKFAAVSTVEELEGFLGAMPKQTNPEMVGNAGGLIGKRHRHVTDGEAHLASLLGLESADINGEFANAVGVTTDGKLIRQDGSIVDAVKLMKGVN